MFVFILVPHKKNQRMKILCILKLNDVKTKIKAGTKEKNKMKWCSDYDPKYRFPIGQFNLNLKIKNAIWFDCNPV